MARILIVEDEPDIRDSLRVYLGAHLPGVQVLVAADGESALEVARTQPVDLVLTDYLMPGIDGLEMLAVWGQIQPASKRIMLTAYPDAGVADRAVRQHGVACVIAKPADPWQIAVAVAQELGIQPVSVWSPSEHGVAA